MANVTLSLEEFKVLEGRAEAAEEAARKLEEELALARCEDPTGRVQNALALVREMLVLARFAVGNMPPEVHAKWPTSSVRAIAKRLLLLPDATIDDQTLAADLNLFADDADREDRDRDRNPQRVFDEQKASSR